MQTASAFGDLVTLIALPLMAATTLGTGTGQMGLLRAAETGQESLGPHVRGNVGSGVARVADTG